MKHLALALMLATAFPVFAECNHAPLPIESSLYNPETSMLMDYQIFRNKLMTLGWLPVSADTATVKDEYIEQDCRAESCRYTYKDQGGNLLVVEKPDDIQSINVICSVSP